MIVLLLLLLLTFPATAVAQEPVATPTAGIEEPEDVADPVDDEDPVDGEDAYTCGEAGTDADYTYCDESAGAGTPTPRHKHRRQVAATVQAVPSGTLPLTGGSPVLVALLGASLVLTGTGLRLRAPGRAS